MLVASDIAEWWDEQHRTSRKALDDFVDEHPNWFGIIVAGTTATTMDLGAGLVDVLRLGEGAAEGGVKGFAKDGLRLLQVAPAAGRLARFGIARLVTDPGGGICTWVSAAKALRQVGARAFASVDDLAAAAGSPLSGLGGAFVHRLTDVLRKLGARVIALANPSRLADVNAAVRDGGVVLFSVNWLRNSKTIGHTLYAFRDSIGRIRYADRTGKVVASLADLERFYPGISAASVYGSASLVLGPYILITEGLAVLALEVRAQLVANPDTVAQTFEVAKMQPMPRASLVHLQKPPSYTVRGGDCLSKLAQQFYGDMFKWPVLYEANRAVIGSNPDLIKPGQVFVVPPLPQVTAKRH